MEVKLEDIGMSTTFSKIVFIYLLCLLILFNIDHGAVPASLTVIKEDLGYSKT